MTEAVIGRPQAGTTVVTILTAITFCHFLNDMASSLLPAIYPMLKRGFDLNFAQIGVITLVSALVFRRLEEAPLAPAGVGRAASSVPMA